MRHRRTIVFCAALCTLWMQATTQARATAAVLFDAQTGQVLHAERADRPWYPASLTKLMTAYVAFEVVRDSKLTGASVLRLSEHANAQEPTKLWLHTDTELTLKTALGAMIVKSANDAAVVVAEGAGGELARFSRAGHCLRPGNTGYATTVRGSPPDPLSLFREQLSGLGGARYDDARTMWTRCRYDAFVHQMNVTANRLGMINTTFANPNGLPDPRQVTTAQDLGLLTRQLIRDFPDYGHIFAARSIRYFQGRLRSYNSLLRTFPGADGMKTGFICASGYNIVSSATREGRRIVAVVLGWSRASQRNARATALLKHGFKVPPTRFGPHDVQLADLPASGDAMMPPQDIRVSLTSRGCRRGPGWRLRYQGRTVRVRALDRPRGIARKDKPKTSEAKNNAAAIYEKKVDEPELSRLTTKNKKSKKPEKKVSKKPVPKKNAARSAFTMADER